MPAVRVVIKILLHTLKASVQSESVQCYKLLNEVDELYFFTLFACRPHSFLVPDSHHQRPARSC